MRRKLLTSAMVLMALGASVSSGAVPSLPEADYPTVDGIVFDDVSAARGVWGPMAGSPRTV